MDSDYSPITALVHVECRHPKEKRPRRYYNPFRALVRASLCSQERCHVAPFHDNGNDDSGPPSQSGSPKQTTSKAYHRRPVTASSSNKTPCEWAFPFLSAPPPWLPGVASRKSLAHDFVTWLITLPREKTEIQSDHFAAGHDFHTWVVCLYMTRSSWGKIICRCRWSLYCQGACVGGRSLLVSSPCSVSCLSA